MSDKKDSQTSTETGILSIRRLCDEAIDHKMGWQSFRSMIEHRLNLETEFIEIERENQCRKDTVKKA